MVSGCSVWLVVFYGGVDSFKLFLEFPKLLTFFRLGSCCVLVRCRFFEILYVSSTCFWFLFDCFKLLSWFKKQIVRFICFHLFYGYVRMFQVVFRVVHVASDRF